MKPRIAMTSSLGDLEGRTRVHVPVAYVDAVAGAGAAPLVFPALEDESAIDDLLDAADGLLLTGGADLDPSAWAEPLHPKADVMDARRQRTDLALIARAEARGMPVLGICLGCQEMAVARGGRLIQHLPDEPGIRIDHGGGKGERVRHGVTIEAASRLAKIVGAGPLEVNSTHHQAVREPGRGMKIVARSPDGVIEAIEDQTPGRFFLAVQWHPEDLYAEPRHRALFEALARAAAEWRKEK